MDNIRVMRVIVYEGPRDSLEAHLTNCVQGTKTFGTKSRGDIITIRAVTISQFPEVLGEVTFPE